MALTYSTYEAKAKFSEVIRHVREGNTVTVSYRGEPVAEIRPIEKSAQTIEERFAELERSGQLLPAKDPNAKFVPGEHVPGALRRFLEDRNRDFGIR